MVMIKRINLLIILLIMFVLVGCFDKKEEVASGPTPEEIANTFAVINGERISKDEYNSFISYSNSVMDIQSRTNEEIRLAFEEDFIKHRLLLQEASRQGIVVDEEKFKDITSSFQTIKGQKKLSEFEKNMNLDFDTLQKLLRQRIIIGKLLESVAGSDIEISEDELKKFYEDKKDELNSDVSAHIQHIVVYDSKVAQNALALIKEGIPFSEVAEKFSVAPEKDSGGDLGFIEVNNYPAIFKEALQLKKGQVSGILKSEYGFHIFKLLEKRRKNKLTFDTLKKKLYAELYGIKQEKKVRDFINDLHENSEIVRSDGSAGVTAQ